MKIRWNTEKYQNCHGRAPRGMGAWAFRVPSLASISGLEDLAEEFLVPTAIEYQDAKTFFGVYLKSRLSRARVVFSEIEVEVCE